MRLIRCRGRFLLCAREWFQARRFAPIHLSHSGTTPEFRQLGNVRCNPPLLIAREQFGRFERWKNLAVALRKFHVGERFLLRQFTPHSVPQAYRRNWKELKGGTHHANRSENCCDTGRCRRNRRRQCGSSRGLVRLSSSLLPPSCSLSLLSPSLLRLLPLLPSSLSPSLLAPLVLARSFFSTASLWRRATAVLATKRVRQFATLAATFAPHCA
jgi:hypothetical protein